MRKIKVLLSVVVALVIVITSISGAALASSTTKALSTNFTLVNLGTSQASVTVDYRKTDGSAWAANSAYTNFNIAPDGGQMIIRQYDTTSGMTPGQGSVVISSSSPLGAVVQIQARNQVPTMGAYNGVSVGSNINYLPLLQRMNSTSSGMANSQIIVQNADSVALNVTISLLRTDGTSFVKNFANLQPGISVYYDLADETGLPTGWVGSAVVSASGTGKLAVVSNLFLGPDGLMSYNAFQQESKTSVWYIPLLTSRLANGQTASVAVQNVSGGVLPANDVQLTCKNVGTTHPEIPSITVENPTQINDQSSYYFNPVIDLVNFPTDWVGSCRVFSKTSKDLVAFAQIRYTNGVGDAAAYEGIPGNSTGTTLYVPLVIKRLSNGVATTATIQNLSTSLATVQLVYTASPEFKGSPQSLTIPNITIDPQSSIIRNYRLPSGAISEPQLPDGWVGTLKVVSDQPVQAYIAITNLYPSGDSLMAHLGFVK